MAKTGPQLEKWELEVVGSDADQTCIAVICLKEDEEKLETASVDWICRPGASGGRKFRQLTLRKLKAQAAAGFRDARLATEEELKQCAPAREDLKLLSDYYRLEGIEV